MAAVRAGRGGSEAEMTWFRGDVVGVGHAFAYMMWPRTSAVVLDLSAGVLVCDYDAATSWHQAAVAV